MLYTSLSQPTIFALFCLSGFLSGFWVDLKNIISTIFRKNTVLNHIFSFLFYFFVFFSYFFINLNINFGEIRFFSLITFIGSFAIQRFIMNNFVAKTLTTWYNKAKEKQSERKKT